MTLAAKDRDPSVDPGVDFYRYANGGWLDANAIPPGFGAWGAIEEVHVRNEEVLERLLRNAADAPSGDLDVMLGRYVASGLDTSGIEAAGLRPIQPYLAAIAAATTHDDVLAVLPMLHRQGFGPFLDWHVGIDHDDTSRYLLWVMPGDLGLPERESYLSESEAATALREAYVDHVAAQLRNAGVPESEASRLATGVLELETSLARENLRAEQRRDPDLTHNRRDVEGFAALAPDLSLASWLTAFGAGAARELNVEQPGYVEALPGIVATSGVEVLKAYLAFHVVRRLAGALPAAVEDEAFAFYGRQILGRQQQRERIKRVLESIGRDMGEAVSQAYVASEFPPSAKERALTMVREIVTEMRTSLETRTWMSRATRERALAKLDAMTVKIGYPDRWRDWSGLVLPADASYAENRLAAVRFEVARQLSRLDQPVDETEWEIPPHVVNAYYHPNRNEIVFPAGILQPPMFDAEADDAVNYGGIGTVIAHEITHGFDDEGRRFDADGALRDWWTEEDQDHFRSLADRLVEQFDSYVAVGDVHVNGRLTLGENIADLGGVALAQRAHARVSRGSGPVDGLAPAQRFFLALATLWRAHTSEQLARTLAQLDPHSPRPLRAIGPLSNLDAFQEAFALPDDAPMMRPRDQRIEIW